MKNIMCEHPFILGMKPNQSFNGEILVRSSLNSAGGHGQGQGQGGRGSHSIRDFFEYKSGSMQCDPV